MMLTQGMIGKKLSVICVNETRHDGKCISYIPAKDNEPEIDSIWLRENDGSVIELYATDIVKVVYITQ